MSLAGRLALQEAAGRWRAGRCCGRRDRADREKWTPRPLFLFAGKVAMYEDIPEELRALIEPIVEDHALELVDVEVAGGGRAGILRVTIDTPEGDGRVPVERCAEVSREIATHLAAEEAMPGPYSLEVSSPGLDRRLAREKDFAAACGREVRLETRRPVDGRRRFRGRLLAFESRVARLRVEGLEVAIRFEEVARANAVYEFTSADFGRRPGG